jgi:3,4-dihydroxy 2-butanone 4-phosphate synthase/GTP cyclohydrolase II
VQFDKVEDAINEVKKGNLVIVVDDVKRENEGDFIGAAAKVTGDTINFMVTEARGAFIAVFCEHGRCETMNILHQRTMAENTESNKTQMMVSVDASKASSGSSAFDRALAVNILADPDAEPHELRQPGHVIPIQASAGGILERDGHTEAGVELVKLAGFKPAVAVDLEILGRNGQMATHEELTEIAEKFDLKMISIEQLKKYVSDNVVDDLTSAGNII